MSLPSSPKHVAIVGGGIHGALSALQLANEGKQVTIFEQLPEANFQTALFAHSHHGSSANASSINNPTTRSLRFSGGRLDHSVQAYLDTRDKFLEVQSLFPDEPFVIGNPSVTLLDKNDTEAIQEMRAKIQQIKKVNPEIDIELWEGADAIEKLRAQYPAMQHYEIPDGCVVMHEAAYHPEKNPHGVSMMVDPAAMIRAAHQKLAALPNVDLRYADSVADLTYDTASATLETARGKETFDHVLFTAGPWTDKLLGKNTQIQDMVAGTVKRVYYANSVPPEHETQSNLAGVMPFVQPESIRAATGKPYQTIMPAAVMNGKLAGVKSLVSSKTNHDPDALATAPLTSAEAASALQDFEQTTGLNPTGEARESVLNGQSGAACMVTTTPDKYMNAGRVKMADGTPSPVSIIGPCSYTGFVLGGAAVNAVVAEINGKEPPYAYWQQQHAPQRDLAISRQVQEALTLEVLNNEQGQKR